MKQHTKLEDQLLDEEDVILKAQQNPNEFRVLDEKYYRDILIYLSDITTNECNDYFRRINRVRM